MSILFITGAGISAPSGIPTSRGDSQQPRPKGRGLQKPS